MKPFSYRDKATQAYQRAKPFILLVANGLWTIAFGFGSYVFDALKTCVLKARDEPFLALAAAATAIYAVFAYRQWDVMSGQLEAMRTDQRPWIPVEPRVASDLSWDSAGDARITIDSGAENTGKSPAVNVEVLAEFTLLRSADPRPDQKRICGPQRDRLQGPGYLGDTLFPNRPAHFQQNLPIPIAAIKQFNKWRTDAYREPVGDRLGFFPVLVGCVDYKSTFVAGHHQTGFIRRLYKDENFPFYVDEGTIPKSRISLPQYEFIGVPPD